MFSADEVANLLEQSDREDEVNEVESYDITIIPPPMDASSDEGDINDVNS